MERAGVCGGGGGEEALVGGEKTDAGAGDGGEGRVNDGAGDKTLGLRLQRRVKEKKS